MPRVRKNCPYPGCHAKHLLRLANHLAQVHNIEDKIERRHFLKVAERSHSQQLIRDLVRIVTLLSKEVKTDQPSDTNHGCKISASLHRSDMWTHPIRENSVYVQTSDGERGSDHTPS